MKPVRVQVYLDREGRWRYRAIAGNNRETGASEQSYAFKWYAKKKARKAYPDGVLTVAD